MKEMLCAKETLSSLDSKNLQRQNSNMESNQPLLCFAHT